MDECRIPGSRPTDLTVSTLTREAQLFIHWCNRAWLEIQGMRTDWNFLYGEFSFDTVADDEDYTLSDIGVDTDFKRWGIDTFRTYLTSAGKADDQWLVHWNYYDFRDTYQFGDQVAARPMVFAVHPQTRALLLGSKPDAVYTVYGNYWKRPTILAADATEVPILDANLHYLIVYKAMMFYGLEQSASEVLARAQNGWDELYPDLEREELPEVQMGAPLG